MIFRYRWFTCHKWTCFQHAPKSMDARRKTLNCTKATWNACYTCGSLPLSRSQSDFLAKKHSVAKNWKCLHVLSFPNSGNSLQLKLNSNIYVIQIPQNELESNPKPRHLECSKNTNLFMQIQMVMFWLKLWLIYHAKLFATNLFTQLAIYQVVFLLFWVSLFMICSFFFCPKYSDPSKLAILRTWTPAVQVQGPFHWRVRSSLGCATSSMFHLTRLGGRCKNCPLIWEELGDDFLRERNRPIWWQGTFRGYWSVCWLNFTKLSERMASIFKLHPTEMPLGTDC